MNKLKGVLLVSLGAISYGILATIVKYASNQGAHTSTLTFFQALVGVVVLFFMMKFDKKTAQQTLFPKSKLRLMLYGTSIGFTSCFYYLSIQYLSVSIGIVLLMQSIWMSVIWEMIQERKWAHWTKILGSFVVILGTLFTTNIFHQQLSLPLNGLILGLLSALSYTISIVATNQVEKQALPITRSYYLVFGGLIVTILFWNVHILNHFDGMVLLKYGIVLGLFGTIIPPIMFTKGVPIIGLGLAGILAVLELPVSVISAQFVLGEQLNLVQWFGVVLIIGTVVFINGKNRKKN